MVSSRDRDCQRIEMTREVIARTPPPAYLFPNQRCQRPDRFDPARRLAPGGGEGRVLATPDFRVNNFFSEVARRLRPAGRERLK